MIRRFLTEVVLQPAQDAAARAMKNPGEDEVTFADILSKAARLCRGVFPKSDFVNYYVRGLKLALWYQLTYHLQLMPRSECTVLEYVIYAAVAAGRTKRAVPEDRRDELSKRAEYQRE